jgi:hypothetical protein
MADYVDDIAFQLGGGVLELEIQSQLPKCVNKALKEIMRYMTTPKLKTVPYSSTIDCNEYKVYSVISVRRPHPLHGTNYGVGDLDVFSMASGVLTSVDPTYYENRMMLIQQRNTISTDMDFIWEPSTKLLRLSVNPPFPGSVTIEYIPDYENVEEVTEPFWQDFILQMATAYAKVITGRIRSKYTLKSSQYELDGQTLLTEGNEELNKIRDYLRENVDLAFPID